MSTLSQLNSVHGSAQELESRDIGGGDLKLRRLTTAGKTKVGVKPLNLDGHIDSLRVLAGALLAQIDSLAERAENETSELNLPMEVRRFEVQLIRSALIRTGGRQRRAARLLGMKVTTLNRKIKQYEIKLDHTDLQEGIHLRSEETGIVPSLVA